MATARDSPTPPCRETTACGRGRRALEALDSNDNGTVTSGHMHNTKVIDLPVLCVG